MTAESAANSIACIYYGKEGRRQESSTHRRRVDIFEVNGDEHISCHREECPYCWLLS